MHVNPFFFSPIINFRFWRFRHDQRDRKRVYRQMAITQEAHERITQLADKKGETIIDTVDIIMGVK